MKWHWALMGTETQVLTLSTAHIYTDFPSKGIGAEEHPLSLLHLNLRGVTTALNLFPSPQEQKGERSEGEGERAGYRRSQENKLSLSLYELAA